MGSDGTDMGGVDQDKDRGAAEVGTGWVMRVVVRDGEWGELKGVILVLSSRLICAMICATGLLGVHWVFLVSLGTNRSTDLQIKKAKAL
jgi:hypothetical protein